MCAKLDVVLNLDKGMDEQFLIICPNVTYNQHTTLKTDMLESKSIMLWLAFDAFSKTSCNNHIFVQ